MSTSIGERILHFDTVGSTNDIAWSYAQDAVNHGLVVIAEEQTAGRGRRGSPWQAPHGTSILASILIFPPSEMQRPFWLTLWTSLAICETSAHLLPQKPTLKWPNDVLVLGKKIAGVMVEQRGQAFVVGFGINLTVPQAFFERNYFHSAAALQHFTCEPIQREKVWHSLLHFLNESYSSGCNGNSDQLLTKLRCFSELEGEEVVLTAGNFTYSGRIQTLQLHEIHLATKQGIRIFAPESVSRIQIQPAATD